MRDNNNMFLRSFAKINLALDILGTRENGYHEVRMVMQHIQLFDKINIEKTEEPGIRLDVNLSYLPKDGKNIAVKAANLLFEEFDLPGGLHIDLNKQIPVSAGLAGGSTNAAAVLYGMNRMYELGLSKKELMDRGAKLGADVPYCIMRGTALAEGIGEILSPLPACPACYVVLVKPPFPVSTKDVYEAYDSCEVLDHPDVDAMIDALKRSNLSDIASLMGNVLEQVTIPMHPEIGRIKEFLLGTGALNAMMSGSGPTVFALYADESTARSAWTKAKSVYPRCTVRLTEIRGL